MNEMIRAANLCKHFGSKRAVDGLNFAVNQGEVFGIVGPDGSGKSTAMHMLTSIMLPTAGDAWVCGYHIVRQAGDIKERIGYMSQRFGLYPDLTVLENLNFYADIYGVSPRSRKARMDQLLNFSGLVPFQRRFAGNLSGGMKQKLGLACALIHSPKVLFLDEPTNGVDPVSRRDFWKILHELLKEGVTILVSTAYLDEAERCGRLALMLEGQVLAVDTPAGIKSRMGSQVLEIRSSDLRMAAALLQEHYGRSEASLFGDRLHLRCSDPSRTMEQSSALLSRHKIAVNSIKRVEPSLEDAFLDIITRKQDSGHGR